MVSLGPARSHSPSPSPQERVSLPLALPLASPAPSSYLRGGVFFLAPGHSADLSPQVLRPRPRPCLRGCAGKSGMCYSASFSDRFWPWRSFGPMTCHARRTLDMHPRTTPQRAPSRGWPTCAFKVRRFNAWASDLLYLVLYFADSTFMLTRLPRPPSSTSRSPPWHPARLLDIPLTSSTSRSRPRHPHARRLLLHHLCVAAYLGSTVKIWIQR